MQRCGASRHHAAFAALPFPDVDRLRCGIKIANVELHKLTAAYARRVKGFQDRTISDAERIGKTAKNKSYTLGIKRTGFIRAL